MNALATFMARMMLVLGFGAALFPVQAAPAPRIRVAIIKGPSGLSGAWMAYQLGSASQNESTYSFLTVAGADMVVAKLLNGEIDAGVLPVNVAAKLHNAGQNVVALAVVGNGMVKFLTTDPGIRSLEDIKGKTIHIAGQKATPDYLFQFLASRKGLAAGTDYTPVYSLAYPEIAAGLATGRVTCAVLPEPYATQALQQNPSIRMPVDLSREWQLATGLADYPMSLLVARKAFMEEQPRAASALAEAYRQSITAALRDPLAIGKLAESLDLGIKAQVAAAAIPVSNFVYQPAARARPSIEAMLSIFLKFEPASVGGRLPAASFYVDFE
ncbi:MAG: MqnA/MqnD/SBP family protein [Rectinemataceae bacterium]